MHLVIHFCAIPRYSSPASHIASHIPRQWHPSVWEGLQETASHWCWLLCLAHGAEALLWPPGDSLERDLISLMALLVFPHLPLCPGAPPCAGRWVFFGLVVPLVAPRVAKAENYLGSPTCCCLCVSPCMCADTDHITWVIFGNLTAKYWFLWHARKAALDIYKGWICWRNTVHRDWLLCPLTDGNVGKNIYVAIKLAFAEGRRFK